MQGTEWRKIDDVLGFLTAMPEPPFVLYLTLQKRKHGWIIAVQNPVLCKDKFVLVVDEDKILFERTALMIYTLFLRRCLIVVFLKVSCYVGCLLLVLFANSA
jgi:CRISPR type IV-associated protein Csf1